ncbi:MAG: DUF5693 family protein [Peptococcaceae bacterium]|nr:DUF5693 family protein [Peptococcaceae bacterium]
MQRFQQTIKRCAAVLVLIAICCSLYVGFDRIQNEQSYKNVNLSVVESDVRALANGNGKTTAQVLEDLKANGVSQILFKETTISSLVLAGNARLVKGADVQTQTYSDQLPEDLPISAGNYYLVVTNDDWRDQVLREVPAKIAGATAYDDGDLGVVTIPTSIEATDSAQNTAAQTFKGIGVGFDTEWMETVADAGFDIVAQVSSWHNPSDASLEMLAEDIKSVPNLAMVMFNDKYLPGYPDKIDTFKTLISDEDGNLVAPLGQIEFNAQDGFNELANEADKDVVRLHTISNQEMSNYEGENQEEMDAGIVEAVDRLDLAARERNMRALLIRFFNIDMPGNYYDTNMSYLNSISTTLTDHGFNVGGDVQEMQSLNVPTAVRLLVGVGICAGFLLMMMEIGLPRLGLIGALLALVAWIGLYFLKPTFAMQMMALASVVEFPILSCLHFLPPKENLTLPKAIGRLLLMCLVSFIGAVLMVGVLSDKAFMLKLSSFIGIKIAHVIPLVVVPFMIYIVRTSKPLALCKQLINKALDYKWAILFVIAAAALMIYVSRTGNDGASMSGAEAGMRQFLNDTLGVRPRSKEFLIGYPATMLYLMYAAKRPGLWLLTLPVIIGQISLVNTYAHIHTPLLISLHRSFNGLVLGIVIGVIAVIVVKLCIRIFRWANDKIAAQEATEP